MSAPERCRFLFRHSGPSRGRLGQHARPRPSEWLKAVPSHVAKTHRGVSQSVVGDRPDPNVHRSRPGDREGPRRVHPHWKAADCSASIIASREFLLSLITGGLEVSGDEPALDVEPGLSEGDLHLIRLDLRVYADTTASPEFGYIECGMPVGRRECGGRDLFGQRADLLEAEVVGSGPVEKVDESAPYARPNPVYVPTHDPHRFHICQADY